MDIESRLKHDIEVFAKEVAHLDVQGGLTRTLEALGLPAPDSDATLNTSPPGADRAQRPAPGGELD